VDYDRLRELQEKFEENPRRYFAPLANEYRKGGQHKRAIEICRAHLAQMPGHMSGQIVFGQALFEAGEWEEARTVFGRALALDPENLIALRSLGDMSLQAGHTVDARNWYMRLLDADPKDAAVIALVTEIDAAPEAAASPAPEVITGVEPGRGDQQIATVTEEAIQVFESPVELAESAPAQTSADVEEPLGLERHYPAESVEEARPEPTFDETALAMEGVTSSRQDEGDALSSTRVDAEAVSSRRDEAAAAKSRQDDADALDSWTPPAGAPVQEQAASAAEAEPSPAGRGAASDDRTFTGASAQPFVNETMAQLYLQQGYRQLALKVYRQLSASRPHDQALKDRIAEIEAADAADHPAEAAVMRSEEPSIETPAEPPAPRSPSIEAPTPWTQPGSEETPGYDRSPIDSPPTAPPSRDRESIESPAREEPRGDPESIAARQPSVREFFATLGRRRPPRVSGGQAMRSSNNMPPDISAPLGTAAPGASLDAVFAGATVSPSDARAASRLAGAFSGATGGARTPPTPPVPTPRVNPRMPPQAQESEEDVAKFRAWLDGLTRE
jgi:tetratricopeptide (TPR) repeat protein